MNKTAIKSFAIWARRKLISDITYRMGMLGITEKGIALPLKQSTHDLQFFDIGTKDYAQVSGAEVGQRAALVETIKAKEHTSDYQTAFRFVVEEVAYTWFNRLIAVRFMEVNDYLPSRVRVLSSENAGKLEPDFVTNPFDTDLPFSDYEKDRVLQLKDENKLDELFRFLFIKQCNKLSDVLPGLFEKISDYTELLLTISFTDKDGIVYHLTHDISEDDFNVEKEGQVEIIGWMYQYYNTEPKDEVFALLKKNVKITKERIPAATQLFTPDWIVRYMVENSLGRLWVEGHPNDDLKSNWKYYLEEAEQEPDVQAQLEKIREEYAQLNPEDIKVIDPCMGSGHILVYAFDMLMQIYTAQGYTQRDAAKSILVNNLYGIDIDTRAYQLAYFAVMMKARQYNRRILEYGILPNLMAVKNPADISRAVLKRLGDLEKLGNRLVDDFTDAEEYGSILNIEYTKDELDALEKRLTEVKESAATADMLSEMECRECVNLVRPLICQARIMGQKYDIVVTNPPYMGRGGMSDKLSNYVNAKFPYTKMDLFAVLMERCEALCKEEGLFSLVTQQSWMFLDSFEKYRLIMLQNDCLVNMVHLGKGAFQGTEGAVTTSFVVTKTRNLKYRAKYIRLVDYLEESTMAHAIEYPNKNILYYATQEKFLCIPKIPIAYWITTQFSELFRKVSIAKYAISDGQTKTGDNDKYIRNIWEVRACDVGKMGYKWVIHVKGGGYRKWYGNIDTVIDWSQEARNHYRKDRVARIAPEYIWFRNGLSWTLIAEKLSVRYLPDYATFNLASPSIFFDDETMIIPIIGYLNTKIAQQLIRVVNPTINTNIGDIFMQPADYLLLDSREKVEKLARENIEIAKLDWDSFETSWDFQRHPLIFDLKLKAEYSNSQWAGDRLSKCSSLSWLYESWRMGCEQHFNQLKANEEELNRIFIDIYGLQEELTPEVDDKDVTVRKADLIRDIKSLISYAVGCMFGRYSLDVPGLAYAGGKWDESKYSTFIPDADNCIPITDEEYFEDDIVGRFVEFIRVAYGDEKLEENLDFIASALGNKGSTSRNTIRQYFLNDFFKDHCQTYSVTGSGKRPIYWLFDSGKQNGFKALVYMHRWNADTVGNVRVEYLHKMQNVYEHELETCQDIIDNSGDNKMIASASRHKEKLLKQMKECNDYDARIAHIALSRVDIDLDDGVKVNYRKVQTGADGKFCEILADSKDIMVKEK